MERHQPRERIRLRRDGQQWEFDRAVKDTGRVYEFQPSARGPLPESVRMHGMISKHLGRNARRLERLADEEGAVGHDATAMDFYFDAAFQYAQAQHTVFSNNGEKRYLHGASLRCYDQVRARAPYTIEHVDIPWGDTVVSGNLHIAPVDAPAPCVFFIPGCDMTKEMVPHPRYNYAAQRGMHLFVFDGPGQGESNLRGIALTTSNYEDAASTALTFLSDRPEIDEKRIALLATSFGSYWGVRLAATDHRVAAAAFPAATVCDPYHLMEEESPRYKQLFSYLTQASSEAELDAFVGRMDLAPIIGSMVCPTLFTIGEFDLPRSPLQEMYEMFDRVSAPAELWVYEDQHHAAALRGPDNPPPMWYRDSYSTAFDWLRDRVDGRPLAHPGQVLYLELSGGGPNNPHVARKRRWYD